MTVLCLVYIIIQKVVKLLSPLYASTIQVLMITVVVSYYYCSSGKTIKFTCHSIIIIIIH